MILPCRIGDDPVGWGASQARVAGYRQAQDPLKFNLEETKKWWLGKKCRVIVDVKLRFERLNRLLVGQLGLHQLENVQMGE